MKMYYLLIVRIIIFFFNWLLTVSIQKDIWYQPPCTKSSATQAGLLYEAHDYEAHGRIADFVVLMTYEWGYRLGPPQAISPINQMRRVVEYALSVMPAEKIFLGFQIYARDWLLPHVKGQEAETFSPQEAIRRAVKYGAPFSMIQQHNHHFSAI